MGWVQVRQRWAKTSRFLIRLTGAVFFFWTSQESLRRRHRWFFSTLKKKEKKITKKLLYLFSVKPRQGWPRNGQSFPTRQNVKSVSHISKWTSESPKREINSTIRDTPSDRHSLSFYKLFIFSRFLSLEKIKIYFSFSYSLELISRSNHLSFQKVNL